MQSSLKQIVEEIVARHHSLLRRELPRITELMDGLAGDCPDNESLSEALQIFKKVRAKIETHLQDEETVLFPVGIALEAGESVSPSDMDLRARLEEMEREHDGCGSALNTIAQMLSTVAECDIRENLLQAIQVVLDDLCIHVEKENTQVHPRIVELLGNAGQ